MRSRFGWAALLVIATVALEAGCLLPPKDQPDGASCGEHSECSSHRCVEGFCGGSECESNRSACEPGWKCIHSVSAVEEFFEEGLGFGTGGAEGDWTCTAMCGSCPGNAHCPEGGKEGETACQFGKGPLTVSLAHVEGKLGEPVRLVATAPTPIRSCSWEFGDGKSEETESGEATHTYETGAPSVRARVSCTDVEGRIGSAETDVGLGCRADGDACTERQCCTPGLFCDDGPSPTGRVCRAPRPITVTVSGPATATVNTTVSFTATEESEASITRVEWTWGDGRADSVGLSRTRTHHYTKAGVFMVRAKVGNERGQTGEGTTMIEITP